MTDCPQCVIERQRLANQVAETLRLAAHVQALERVIASCEPLSWACRPGEPNGLEPHWALIPYDMVKQARAALASPRRSAP